MSDSVGAESNPIAPSAHEGTPLAAEQVSLEVVDRSPVIMDRRAQRFVALCVAMNVVVSYLPMLGDIGLCSSLLLFCLPFLYLAGVGRRMRRLDRELAGTLPGPLQGARIKVVGRPEQLAPLKRVHDEFFEPRFYRYAGIRSLRDRALMIIVICIACVAGFVAVHGSAGGVPWFIDPLVRMSPSIVLIPVVWLALWWRAQYLRLVPGSLDVLESAAFRDRMCLVARHDLRCSRILIRFDKTAIEIESPTGEKTTIKLGGVNSPLQFVRDFLQAAVCTHPAPPLPDDALLG